MVECMVVVLLIRNRTQRCLSMAEMPSVRGREVLDPERVREEVRWVGSYRKHMVDRNIVFQDSEDAKNRQSTDVEAVGDIDESRRCH